MTDGSWPYVTQPDPAQPPVVVTDTTASIEDAVRAKPARPSGGIPKWEADARERVRAGVRKFSKPLGDLVARDANEGDTRLLITDFLCEALGFDKYADLTTEYAVKGEFADYGIRIDKDLVAFLEVKRVTTKLTTKHLRQVEMYAVNEGVEWVILTNGVEWRAYHLSGGLPVEIDLALEVNLLGPETPAQKANLLFYLSRESMKRRQIDDLWRARRATSPKSIAAVLLSDPVLDAVRKQLRKTTGQNAAASDLRGIIRDSVIRTECM
ncbi:Type I restriction enzyme R protein N terminus (HSDR N) [Gaiella occulta]|uniref:Type I restriction enzyme R protein N terminus (HSDR N) n=1 Tax=Gaiella occulta TaxID=1002870 RepID=A0A7M2YTB7_9ACTN|nr:type I restriction enzyme HsdR N-terminal domain-containing protein [Gaiella occulta]RDI73326.1 Type I restriction enzyme R protein N terminus (HSDR N) [Gaiella occulta]